MLLKLTNAALISAALSLPHPTDLEIELAERLRCAIEEVDELTRERSGKSITLTRLAMAVA